MLALAIFKRSAPSTRSGSERARERALSPRELDNLEHLSAGKYNKVIARLAGIDVGTVKYHVDSILSKLNVSCRTEAASVAFGRGMLQSFPVSAFID